jgi:hypothetical protein
VVDFVRPGIEDFQMSETRVPILLVYPLYLRRLGKQQADAHSARPDQWFEAPFPRGSNQMSVYGTQCIYGTRMELECT